METAKLRCFVQDFTRLVDAGGDETRILSEGRPLLGALLKSDDWLPDFAAVPHEVFYRQYLLYCDPLERFSMVSFVWGPGQKTPIHDHMTWGMIGMLRGQERSRSYERTPTGMRERGIEILSPGQVDIVSPTHGDIHQVSNVSDTDTAISIHVYGGNIGKIARRVYDPLTGEAKNFISGYSNEYSPNIW